jgi:predicted phage terminase large subunit-like protein
LNLSASFADVARAIGYAQQLNSRDRHIAALEEHASAKAVKAIRKNVLQNEFIPQVPTPKQAGFLAYEGDEALYGGAAGPGKSSAILMAALQHVNTPGYAAIIFRRTYKDLSLPGALMDRSKEWLTGKAHWNDNEKKWTFPSGATLDFGYLEAEQDKYRYQSAEFQFIGFDELTQFSETQYLYLFSRLRRLATSTVPLRMRAASNPGGLGHAWVKQRFITSPEDRVFVRGLLEDNPHLDRGEYEKSLAKLDHVTRKQLREGDWDISPEGGLIKSIWWQWYGEEGLPDAPKDFDQIVCSWDLAMKDVEDADFTVGLVIGRKGSHFYVLDCVKARMNAPEQLASIKALGKKWPAAIAKLIEDKANGPAVIQLLRMEVPGIIPIKADASTGGKQARLMAVSPLIEAGQVWLPKGRKWGEELVGEASSFPAAEHDDMCDAMSQGLSWMMAAAYMHVPEPKPDERPLEEVARESLWAKIRAEQRPDDNVAGPARYGGSW